MRKSRNNQFVTIRVEGAILPVDLIQRVSDGDKSLGGLNPTDYHLIGTEKLNEATNRSWNRMLGAWATFKRVIGDYGDKVLGDESNPNTLQPYNLTNPKTLTSVTRERWLLPLFQELGYGRLNTARAMDIGGKSFAVSHFWGKTPIHLVGSGVDLDTRTEGVAGAARMTPHGLVQELLNRSDDYLWGFVSNGLRLRILRDNSSLTRQAFVEFDLEAMMEGEAYSDFVLLWLLCHQSRVEADKPEECWLEKWSKAAQEQGTRALDQLRNGVTSAIAALGSGFISHPANSELKEKLRSGSLDKQDYYRELLRLVYRLLFIFVAEDRDLLLIRESAESTPLSPSNPNTLKPLSPLRKARERYNKYYSTSRVRRLAGRKRGTKHPDLFYALRLVMQKLGSDEGCPDLALPALGSFLFSPEAIANIQGCEIANVDFMAAIRALAYTMDGGALRPVDYKNLGSEELGSVYESLLELHPELNLDAGVFELRTAAGNERKTTGSYYTPSGLIHCLLDSALDPVLDAAVKGDGVIGLYGSKGERVSGRQNTDQVIQRPPGVETGNGTGEGMLPVDTSVSQGRTVRDGQPDQESIEFHSSQHSGGQREGFSQGLYPVSENSAGQRSGIGDSSAAEHGSRTGNAGSLGTSYETTRIGGDSAGQTDPLSGTNTPKPYNHKTLKPSTAEERLLALKICDPACGSGHFLIAASHRLAKRVAMVRTGDIEPSPDAVRAALRQVISKCIYGVDINPMSVELCKVALWMEAIDPGKPLSFLDHHIQCGNSLIGATPRLLKDGIPDVAFDPIEGDDKAVCSEYKKRNKKEREGQGTLFSHDLQPWEQLGNLSTAMMNIDSDDDGSIDFEHRKQDRYENLVKSTGYEYGRLLADTWCAAFMWKKTRQFDYPITEEVFRRIERTPHACPEFMQPEIGRLAKQYQFFHWHLAFPNVFRVPGKDEEPENEQSGWIGGFDCVLGNPPWDKVEPQEQQFFGTSRPDIALAEGAKRKALMADLKTTSPELYGAWKDYQRTVGGLVAVSKNSSAYPLSGIGRLNTYSLFTERSWQLMGRCGRAGLIVQSGLATDESNKELFTELVSSGSLASLYDFENREAMFPAVHREQRFCLVAIRGQGSRNDPAEFAFWLTSIREVTDPQRRFTLSPGDFDRMSPNTGACPTFRNKEEAEIVRAMYAKNAVIKGKLSDQAKWAVRFAQFINMTSDSGQFQQVKDGSPHDLARLGLVPVYEAKLTQMYDHRQATFASATGICLDDSARDVTLDEHRDPGFVATPRYYMAEEDLAAHLSPLHWERGWLACFHNIANPNNERTAIFCVVPLSAVGNSAPIVVSTMPAELVCNFIAIANSLPFDFVVRRRIGSRNLNFFVLEQLPMPSPDILTREAMRCTVPRALELVYTSWDIKAFGDDVWREADDALRGAMVRQWEDNRAATGGHEWAPPEWAEIDEDGIKLPPFKWDEDRRAVLRAELDAYYAQLYGLNRKQLRYILDPHGLSKNELEDILDPWEDPTCSGPHLLPAEPALDFPGETFRVLKNKEEKQFGEYRTRRLVLEAWERLHAQGLMPEAYDQRGTQTSEETQ